MLTIRNRHYGSPARELLPWGDPYILQLFEPDGANRSGAQQETAKSKSTGLDMKMPTHQDARFLSSSALSSK